MEQKDKADQIDLAIQQHQQLIQCLQLEALQGDYTVHQQEPPDNLMELSSTTKAEKEPDNNGVKEEDETRAIIKHLKDIKRQNFVTQCLLSAMIMLTLTWQLSEVSFLFKVKNRISHPFSSFRDMFKGVIKGPNWNNITQNGDKQSSDQNENDGALIPTIKIPELPNLGLDNDEK